MWVLPWRGKFGWKSALPADADVEAVADVDADV